MNRQLFRVVGKASMHHALLDVAEREGNDSLSTLTRDTNQLPVCPMVSRFSPVAHRCAILTSRGKSHRFFRLARRGLAAPLCPDFPPPRRAQRARRVALALWGGDCGRVITVCPDAPHLARRFQVGRGLRRARRSATPGGLPAPPRAFGAPPAAQPLRAVLATLRPRSAGLRLCLLAGAQALTSLRPYR